MKILLTAIFKDDSEIVQIERMLKSFMPYMSGLAVAITGLSGKTKKLEALIKSYKGEYVLTSPKTHPEIYLKDEEGKDFFASFAAARNVAFDLAKKMQEKGKYDWWSWADCDDVLLSGSQLHEVAAQAKKHNADWVYVPYWYAVRQNEQGEITNIQVEHMRERLLSPKIPWKWKSRLHEICVSADENYTPKLIASEYNEKEGGIKLVWCHLPPEGHHIPNLYRNVQILEVQAKEEQHKDPRTLFYLAKCYVDIATLDKKPEMRQLAIFYLKEYLEMSGWPEERGYACQYLGMLAAQSGNIDSAIQWYHKAIQEHPISHLPYLWLSSLYADKKMTEESDHWLNIALQLPKPKTRTTIGSPEEIMLLATKLNYNKAIREENLEDAIEWRKKWNVIEHRKDEGDEVLEELRKIYDNNQAATWVHNYAVFLKNKGHKAQLENLMASIAPEFAKEAFVQKLMREVLPPKKWKEKEIAYICATPVAPWSPNTAMKDGIGGSETAAIKLSEEWVKKGWKVTLYGNVTEDAKVNGVTYKHWNQLNLDDDYNIVIIWRNIGLIDEIKKAKKILVDLHDVQNNVDWTLERIAKVDKVMVKSKFHRSMIPNVPDEKIKIISNGI